MKQCKKWNKQQLGACSQVVTYFIFYSAKHAGLRNDLFRKTGIAIARGMAGFAGHTAWLRKIMQIIDYII